MARTTRTAPPTTRSWNCGVEGPTDDKAIIALRERQKRNMLATLLFSQGTPMLLGGDEFGRTQSGNNNAYCQDSEISWFNWSLTTEGKDLLAFTKRLIKLLGGCSVLRRSRFLTGEHDPDLDVRDVTWINANGGPMEDAHWKDGNMKCFGMLLDGRAQKTGIHKPAEDQTMLMILNGFEGTGRFHDARGVWRTGMGTSGGYQHSRYEGRRGFPVRPYVSGNCPLAAAVVPEEIAYGAAGPARPRCPHFLHIPVTEPRNDVW